MRTTILLAGLVAGLTGGAVLAQVVATPEADTAPMQTAPADPGNAAELAPQRGIPAGLPGLAPLELYDTDGDGLVTQAEIQARRAERFAQADADGDGALSVEELLALEEAIREEARLARATQAVARMDDSGDGLLQAEEIEARSPQLAPLFDRLDADGDGGISQAEAAAAHPARGDFGPGGHGHHGRGHGSGDHGGGFGWGLMGGLIGG